jgi:Kef-type K+ transport system membrane component KefB
MDEFMSFLLVISSGLFFSGIFRRFDVPYVIALIFAGVVIGPFGLGIFVSNPAIAMLGAIGVIFLMFMAGLETHIKRLRDIEKGTWYLLALNSTIPFMVGMGIGHLFGYPLFTSFILGILFISSSIAVIVPQLEKTGLMKRKLGKTILTSAIFEDIASLLLLSVVLQATLPKTMFPLPLYLFVILFSIVMMKIAFPKIDELYAKYFRGKRDTYEGELRLVFVMLIGSAIFFEALGMHAIVAGFIVGMVLSQTVRHEHVLLKLRTISYGVFIPIFFVVLGTGIDLSVFTRPDNPIVLMLVIIAGLVSSKVISGYIAGRISGFKKTESMIMGVATTPQLSTTLAAAFAAQQFGILDNPLITSLIALSVFTTFFTPIVMNALTNRLPEPKKKKTK